VDCAIDSFKSLYNAIGSDSSLKNGQLNFDSLRSKLIENYLASINNIEVRIRISEIFAHKYAAKSD